MRCFKLNSILSTGVLYHHSKIIIVAASKAENLKQMTALTVQRAYGLMADTEGIAGAFPTATACRNPLNHARKNK